MGSNLNCQDCHGWGSANETTSENFTLRATPFYNDGNPTVIRSPANGTPLVTGIL
jgi:hypothetical protein